MSGRYNSSDIGYQDKEWDDYVPSFGMLHSQKPPTEFRSEDTSNSSLRKGEWVLNGDDLQKWECDTCGIYLWVEDRDEVECPNCNTEFRSEDTSNSSLRDGE